MHEQLGPVIAKQVQQAWHSHKVNAGCYAWKEGMDGWRAYSNGHVEKDPSIRVQT